MEPRMSCSARCSARLTSFPAFSGGPAQAQLLQRAHVEVAVVEEALQARHVAVQEAAVEADAVPAHRRRPRRHPALEERQRPRFRLRLRAGAGQHPFGEPRAAVLLGVPLVHRREDAGGLANRDLRPVRQHPERRIGDDGGDLDDLLGIGIETGHLQIDPDEVGGVRNHGQLASRRATSARARVPPSTNSSSPPIGTPCAIRVARMPRSRTSSAR